MARLLCTEQLTIVAGSADGNRRKMQAGVVNEGAKAAAVSRTAENKSRNVIMADAKVELTRALKYAGLNA